VLQENKKEERENERRSIIQIIFLDVGNLSDLYQ
jgi:hypothetical protein